MLLTINPQLRVDLGLGLFALLMTASCNLAETPVAVSPQHVAILFAQLQVGDSAPDIQAVLAAARRASRTDPNWPTLTYLVGEAHLKRKDVEQARKTFRDLAVWAGSDQSGGPSKDGWGGSGVAAIALWRWLRIVDAHGGTAEEVEEAVAAAPGAAGV